MISLEKYQSRARAIGSKAKTARGILEALHAALPEGLTVDGKIIR